MQLQMFQQAFPDLKHIVHETIGGDDSVAARWTVRGTHRGEFQGIPASGKSIDVSGITTSRTKRRYTDILRKDADGRWRLWQHVFVNEP